MSARVARPVISNLLVVTAVLLFCPTGFASTAFVDDDGEVVYEADPGEENHVIVTGVRIIDTGATITPGVGCSTVSANEVECAEGFETVNVSAGDLDDFVSVEGWTDTCCEPVFVSGGDGDDMLVGGNAQDELFGGAGADSIFGGRAPRGNCVLCGGNDLSGGPGDDLLRGGANADRLSGDEGADVLNGGAGRDTVSYAGSAEGVRIRLDGEAGDGAPGENDYVNRVENIDGSDHHDTLIGNRQNNRISGFRGSDRIRGGAGNDLLDGFGGNDRIKGGDGSDRLLGSRGSDTLIAGEGHDVLLGGSRSDTLYARDGTRDRVGGSRGNDRGRVDRGLDIVRSVESFF